MQDLPLDIFNLTKYRRSNQNTCINQKPIVRKGQRVKAGRRHRRRAGHRPGRAGARPQRARRLHAVGRVQLRGRDPRLRAARQGRPLHLDPHRGVRGPGARHQAGQGRGHPRHPERLRRGPQGPRRFRNRAHRRQGEGRRHPGRQDHAEGRDPADAGGEAAAGDLRREGRRRARHLAHGAARHRGHRGRREGVLAARRRQGRARQVDRGGGDRPPREGLPGRDRDGRDGARPEAQEPPGRQDRRPGPLRPDQQDPAGHQEGRPHRAGGPRQLLLERAEEDQGQGGRGPRPDDQAHRGAGRGADRHLRLDAGGAHRPPAPRRRPAARRHQDGEGLRGREAQAVGRRQDGRPPRQQGRRLQGPPRRGHAVPAGRHARSRSCSTRSACRPG